MYILGYEKKQVVSACFSYSSMVSKHARRNSIIKCIFKKAMMAIAGQEAVIRIKFNGICGQTIVKEIIND